MNTKDWGFYVDIEKEKEREDYEREMERARKLNSYQKKRKNYLYYLQYSVPKTSFEHEV